MTTSDSLPLLPPRDPKGHKGTFGTVAIVGGSCAGETRMIGAPALAALGALRAGAGLVKLVMPAPILDAAIGIVPSATGVAIDVDERGEIAPHDTAELIDRLTAVAQCLVIGMGFGIGAAQTAAALRAAQQQECPVVFDADALTALAGVPELHKDFRANAILTPHPGEFKRLASAFRLNADATDDAKRPGAAESLAQRLGCIVVLKGAGTVVSDGLRTWVCDRGHPCMATGGTGDVLAGVIGGLVAQLARPIANMLPDVMGGREEKHAWSLYDIARVAVHVHARAGVRWAEAHHAEAGMLAAELAAAVPGAMEEMRGKTS